MSKEDHESVLGRLRTGLRDSVDAELRRDPPRPDFDAMMARVREMDERVADRYAEPTESADTGAPDLVDVDEVAATESDRQALEPWVTALRERVDGDIAARRRAGPWPAAPRPRRRTAAWMTISVIASAAAALALFVDLGHLPGGQSVGGELAGMAAADTAQRADWGGDASVRSPKSRRARVTVPAELDAEFDLDGATSEVSDPVALEAIDALIGADGDDGPVVEPAEAKPRQLSLEQLDARAQQQWRAGRTKAAEGTYWKIVKRGGTDPRVELAYAELFSLVRQRGGDLTSVWRRYLKAFPRGRYASDAQAGLCRRAAESARESCWQDYRVRFPRGIHAPDNSP